MDELKWIWFGHSSSLLQIEGKNVLMDPVFSNYTSPIPFIGPKRFSKLPIDIENMPMIDVLALSHDHYDHLDYQTIKQIDKKVKVYCVPLGVEKHLLRWGIDENKIHVMNWWDEVKIDGLTITSTPGRHLLDVFLGKTIKHYGVGMFLKMKNIQLILQEIPVMEIISRKFMKSLVTLIY